MFGLEVRLPIFKRKSKTVLALFGVINSFGVLVGVLYISLWDV